MWILEQVNGIERAEREWAGMELIGSVEAGERVAGILTPEIKATEKVSDIYDTKVEAPVAIELENNLDTETAEEQLEAETTIAQPDANITEAVVEASTTETIEVWADDAPRKRRASKKR